jgi:hypothetical protein
VVLTTVFSAKNADHPLIPAVFDDLGTKYNGTQQTFHTRTIPPRNALICSIAFRKKSGRSSLQKIEFSFVLLQERVFKKQQYATAPTPRF